MNRISEEEYLQALSVVRMYLSQVKLEVLEAEKHEFDIDQTLRSFWGRGLGTRTITVLRRNYVYTFRDVLEHTDRSLYNFRGMGDVSIQELEDFLASKNLKLKNKHC